MANQNEKGFKSGMIAGLELYGRVCGKQANCEQCPVGSIRGTGVTCQDFAKQFPASRNPSTQIVAFCSSVIG